MVSLYLLDFVHIHYEERTERPISPINIGVALVQFFFPALKSIYLNWESLHELVMEHQLLICILDLEASTLEEAFDQSCLIIISISINV